MARSEIEVDAPPADVWALLADARSYGHWVVGSSEIRAADDGFPAAGTRFHHKVGMGPLKIADHTLVEESLPPHRLKLRARARPAGTATVILELTDLGQQTHVAITEKAADPLSRLVLNRFTDPLVRLRNAESLRRLKAMAEGRGPSLERASRP